MMPDYDRAAIKALEVLRDSGTTETPIDSFSIILQHPGVRVISFTKFAMKAEMERNDLIPLFGENQDAATFKLGTSIKGVDYVVVYNMRLPIEIVWRGVARELGHIVLGHDGTRPADVRLAEAMCFAHHLLSPRPIIHMLQEEFPLTMNVLTDTMGCSSECVDDLRNLPGVNVPKELNREIRDLFRPHISEYMSFHKQKLDRSPIVDFGTFMDGYTE